MPMHAYIQLCIDIYAIVVVVVVVVVVVFLQNCFPLYKVGHSAKTGMNQGQRWHIKCGGMSYVCDYDPCARKKSTLIPWLFTPIGFPLACE